jgi:hypothetical protein
MVLNEDALLAVLAGVADDQIQIPVSVDVTERGRPSSGRSPRGSARLFDP